MGGDDMVKRNDVLRWLRHTGMVHAIASFAANFPRSTPATPGDAAPTRCGTCGAPPNGNPLTCPECQARRRARAPSLEVAPPPGPPPGYHECPNGCGRWTNARASCRTCAYRISPRLSEEMQSELGRDWTPPATPPQGETP